MKMFAINSTGQQNSIFNWLRRNSNLQKITSFYVDGKRNPFTEVWNYFGSGKPVAVFSGLIWPKRYFFSLIYFDSEFQILLGKTHKIADIS
jgi:hypothetical protein